MNLPLAAVDQDAPPGLEEIQAAAVRLRGRVHHTPVLGSASIDRDLGARVLFKCENFQRVGAFKARGATNAVLSLDDAEAKRGVATHSSGNHGAALALAAAERGIPCWVVVPGNATGVKRDAIARYGAQIVDCAPTMTAREAGLARVVAETGAAVVHPFDDYRVIAGQGTAALEMLDAEPDIDLLLCPVGGGGLISGCAIVAASRTPPVRVVGCEPAGADDARQSFLCGRTDHAGHARDHGGRSARVPRRTQLRHHPRAGRRHRHGRRGGDRVRHAADLGTDEDPDRAVGGGAGGSADKGRGRHP